MAPWFYRFLETGSRGKLQGGRKRSISLQGSCDQCGKNILESLWILLFVLFLGHSQRGAQGLFLALNSGIIPSSANSTIRDARDETQGSRVQGKHPWATPSSPFEFYWSQPKRHWPGYAFQVVVIKLLGWLIVKGKSFPPKSPTSRTLSTCSVCLLEQKQGVPWKAV